MEHGCFGRRQVLAGLSASLALRATALRAAPPVLHAFLHESGKPAAAAGRPFAVGALLAAEPGRLAEACARLRRATGFRGALRYADTSRFKLDYARRVFDVFMAEPGSRFAAIVMTADAWPATPDDRRSAYHDLYGAVLQASLGAGSGAIVHKALHRTVGPDRPLDDHLLAQAPVIAIEPAGEGLADLAQLCALLTGCAGGADAPPRNRVKSALLADIAAGLGVASLADPRLAAGPKFTLARRGRPA